MKDKLTFFCDGCREEKTIDEFAAEYGCCVYCKECATEEYRRRGLASVIGAE